MAKGRQRGFYARLALIHRAYAWSLLFMAVSGLLLYLPFLRAPLAGIRVPLKWLHIAGGVTGIAIMAIYAFDALRHWRSLGRLVGRRINLIIAVTLALGWSISGTMLWWDRVFLPWTAWALWWHDVFTWVGVIYLSGHAFVRGFGLDFGLPWARLRPERPPYDPDNEVAAYHRMQETKRRRLFLRRGAELAGILAILSTGWFYRLARVDPRATAEPAVPYDPLPVPSPQSLPPVGGGARGRFRIYNVARAPFRYDPSVWRLTVDGLVASPVSLEWPQVLELPRHVWVRDFHCVSGWSVYNVTWEGILLSDLLDLAGPSPGATHVKFYSFDRVYTDALTIEQARLDDVFVAVLKDGKPLTHAEGGPVRLVVSRMFGYKSVKWLERIELIDEPHLGFWQRLGYEEDAWIPGVPKTGPLPKVIRS